MSCNKDVMDLAKSLLEKLLLSGNDNNNVSSSSTSTSSSSLRSKEEESKADGEKEMDIDKEYVHDFRARHKMIDEISKHNKDGSFNILYNKKEYNLTISDIVRNCRYGLLQKYIKNLNGRNIFIYVRKSAASPRAKEESTIQELSLDTQINKCYRHIDENKIQGNVILINEGIRSGYKDLQPYLLNLILLCMKKDDLIICSDVTRLCRNVKNFNEFISKKCEKEEVEIHTIDDRNHYYPNDNNLGNLDSNTKFKTAIINSEHECKKIALRIRDALRNKDETGNPVFQSNKKQKKDTTEYKNELTTKITKELLDVIEKYDRPYCLKYAIVHRYKFNKKNEKEKKTKRAAFKKPELNEEYYEDPFCYIAMELNKRNIRNLYNHEWSGYLVRNFIKNHMLDILLN